MEIQGDNLSMELVPCPNASGIIETIGHPEFVLVLHRHFWPLGRVSCLAH
jgi:hypothetical protein